MTSIHIRPETAGDITTIFEVEAAAFQREEEATLVDQLRAGAAFIPGLSLVAEIDHQIVGHILFTRLQIKSGEALLSGILALAPVAVLPAYQSMGIGGSLIRKGLEVAREMGYKAVIVLGHEHYYPKFGFMPAVKWNIRAPMEVPDANFMVLELVAGALDHISGVVVYAPEFGIA
ncbi:N-acetyltransferase [Chitinophaga sp.]|uniref:GNAT family N-acetyltransferase n=1 Tax=Chitinophaga sp. TaxID=1869181 RepID=UPI002F925582